MTAASAPSLPSPFERYRHIVIEGPIGAGKTSLARRLAERFDAELVLEEPADNPFLERFYRDSRRYALPTQLYFLFQRVAQLRELSQRDLFAQAVVGDFLLDKDPLFARLTLDDDELRLYQNILASVQPQAPIPDLVICLQAPPDTLIERIRRRGIEMETSISETYLRALIEQYSSYFYDYEAATLLIVNTERLNPVDSEEDFQTLVRHLAELRGRRSFFSVGQ
ncbi:MAG: deoxynucleoside kinase [Betaproteobacteria bacterium]